MIGARDLKVSKTLSFRRGGRGGERRTNEWVDTVQCGREPVDMSTECHENEGTDHLTQLAIT